MPACQVHGPQFDFQYNVLPHNFLELSYSFIPAPSIDEGISLLFQMDHESPKMSPHWTGWHFCYIVPIVSTSIKVSCSVFIVACVLLFVYAEIGKSTLEF